MINIKNDDIILKNDRICVRLANNCSELELSADDKISWNAPNPFKLTYDNAHLYDLPQHCQVTIKQASDRMVIKFYDMVYWARFKGHGYHKPDPAQI
jgi:hypothetical protein